MTTPNLLTYWLKGKAREYAKVAGVRHSAALEHIAHRYGYADWNTAAAMTNGVHLNAGSAKDVVPKWPDDE